MDSVRLRHLLTRIVESDDGKAFSEFFDCYYTRLMNFAMIFIPQYDQAEEVVSEVFLKLLNMKGELLKIDRFEGYMFMMVKNHALNFLNLMKREQANILIDDIKDHMTSDFIDPDKRLINNDLQRILTNAIEQLPPKRRLVFKMVKDEGMSHKETAELLELSVRTVEVHLKLAIKDLRRILLSFYEEHKDEIGVSNQRFLSFFLSF